MPDPAAPPAASGLSRWSTQVLGGLPGVNWTDIFARLLGMGNGPSLAGMMMPQGGIPQLGQVTPPPMPITPPAPMMAARAEPAANLLKPMPAVAPPGFDPALAAFGVGGMDSGMGLGAGVGLGIGTAGGGVAGGADGGGWW